MNIRLLALIGFLKRYVKTICLPICYGAAKRYSPYLRNYYERIKKHRGSGKAIVATARKFLGIIYNTLKNGWVLGDFPTFVIAKLSVILLNFLE